MKMIITWLLNRLYFVFAFSTTLSFADMEKSVTLTLSFDQLATPHANFVINGTPVYAMVDTGSSFGFHLYQNQLNKIKGLKKERTYRSTDGKGKVQENIAYLAKSLDMNGLKLRDVPVTPFKQWGLMISGEGELPQSQVVGLGAFKDKQILLDYKGKSLTIGDNIASESQIKENFQEYSFQMSSDGMIFQAEQSGHKYHLIMDTGSTVSIIWRERLKSRQPESCLIVDPEMDNEGCEALMLETKSKNGKIEHFGAVIVAGDFEHMGNIDGLIGNNFLKSRKLLIDFKNNKVFISDDNRKG